jgi:hypothetical protein
MNDKLTYDDPDHDKGRSHVNLVVQVELEPLEDGTELDPDDVENFRHYIAACTANAPFFLRATATFPA